MLCMKLRDQCLDRQYVLVIDVISHFGYVSKLNVSLLFVVEVFMRRTGGDLAAPAFNFLSCSPLVVPFSAVCIACYRPFERRTN